MSVAGKFCVVVLMCLSLHCCLVHESDHVMALLDGGVLMHMSSLWTVSPLVSHAPQFVASASFSPSLFVTRRQTLIHKWRLLSTAPSSGALKFRTNSSNNDRWATRLGRFFKSLKWTPIPLCVGFALIAYQRYRFIVARERKHLNSSGKTHSPVVARPWEVSAYRFLPLRSLSRLWGAVNNIELPFWARQPVLGWYVRKFGCDLSEAAEADLLQYRNLGELFRRRLRPDARPVDTACDLVSPVDGTVLQLSAVSSCRLEQIKGVSYSLHDFFGPLNSTAHGVESTGECGADVCEEGECGASCHHQLMHDHSGSRLYQCVLYLAPGDYHRFHAPTDWRALWRRHFAGHLLSVSPLVAGWMPSLFCLNERAIYAGRWKHGFFSMTAVGATNVGSMHVYCDQELTTNCPGWQPRKFFDKILQDDASEEAGEGVSLTRGAMFGEFNLGSTVVLLFEAPADFQFAVKIGEKVRVGQALSGGSS